MEKQNNNRTKMIIAAIIAIAIGVTLVIWLSRKDEAPAPCCQCMDGACKVECCSGGKTGEPPRQASPQNTNANANTNSNANANANAKK